jgi:hypothetical protein
MSIVEKLKKVQAGSNTRVILRYEAAAEVLHYFDNYRYDALVETKIASKLANLVINVPAVRTVHNKTSLLNAFREDDLLDESDTEKKLSDCLADAMNENWGEYEMFDFSLDEYDHKRGEVTITTSVALPYDEALNAEEWMLTGWTAVVKTDLGTLEIK